LTVRVLSFALGSTVPMQQVTDAHSGKISTLL